MTTEAHTRNINNNNNNNTILLLSVCVRDVNEARSVRGWGRGHKVEAKAEAEAKCYEAEAECYEAEAETEARLN